MSKKSKFARGIPSRRKPRGQRRLEGRKVLVATEGVLTEPQYFERLQQLPEFAHIQIITDPKPPRGSKGKNISRGSDPLSVVEACGKKKQEHTSDYDSYYCVVDVDHYHRAPNNSPSTLDKAIEHAKSKDIKMAISNPAFEFWLQCHYPPGKQLQMKGNKGMDTNFPYENFKKALEIADQRAINAQGEPVELNTVGSNPSTGMPRLIEELLRKE